MHQGIGCSDDFLAAMEKASILAKINRPVLINGERGTGKELVAERLHFLSPRWEGPFLKINCAAMNSALLESTLFGHEQGAFTGAHKKVRGSFQRAEGGTLFLDEIASAAPSLGEKLLRAIEYGEYTPLGSDKTLKANVRIIAATHGDLITMTKNKEFRADLLDRLSFDVITLPPLRVRGEDIQLLADHFALQLTKELKRPSFAGFSENALNQLRSYPWPGNVRELKNTVERTVFYAGESTSEIPEIVWNDLQTLKPASTQSPEREDTPSDLKSAIRDLEQSLLKKALKKNEYNQTQAAKDLGITYHQLRGLLKKHRPALQAKPLLN